MHHDPELQRHVEASASENKATKLLKRWRWFGLFVLLPSLLATLYYGVIAADVYVSESRFVIKAPDRKQAAGSSLGAILQSTGLEVQTQLAELPMWWAFLSESERSKRKLHKLNRAGLFDGQAYLDLYPDVAEASMDPLRHYLLHGMEEGRTLTR